MDERVKEFVDLVKDKALTAAEITGKAAGCAAKKAEKLVDVTKLNFQIMNLNNEIDRVYKEIGKLVYLTHTGAQIDENKIEDMIADIDDKFARVAECRAKLAEKKSVTVCPTCGQKCSASDVSCDICGTSL